MVQTSWAQNSPVRERALGVSFILNDFKTAQRIRNGSIDQVIREDNWAKFSDMAPGLALTYFKGLHKNVDFAATMGASFVNYPLPNNAGNTNAVLQVVVCGFVSNGDPVLCLDE